jgi:transcriptional regulator with XRE-family HTH domain
MTMDTEKNHKEEKKEPIAQPEYKIPSSQRETQGQRLRRMRDQRGIKQGHIAKIADITQAHMSRIENDETGVTKNTLRKIAEALGIHFDDLYVPKVEPEEGPHVMDIDEVLASDSAMLRFMGGERPDDATLAWVKRSLDVIRKEIKQKRGY